ncbi:hypothetical protein DFH29DRAFT_246079 [Suillus ampliporus]|nr:hypothetical protein DFH29DRAFT_246079 [Suillus ampliporus]
MTPASQILIVRLLAGCSIYDVKTSPPKHPIMRLLLCMILYLIGVIQAAPATSMNATVTSDGSEAPSLTNRTLGSIISSCLLTLFTCTYSGIHPNIPSPKDSRIRVLWRRLGIMVMASIAPELIVTWGIGQWLSARRVITPFPCRMNFDDYEGYGAVHALTKPFKQWVKTYASEQSEDYTWTQTHSFFVLMGGFMLYVNGKPYRILSPGQLDRMVSAGCIDAPTLTAKQICDQSKGNAISKGLVMLQVVWFALQLMSRALYRLETTLLEAGTLAFVVLSFVAYVVWWNKPLDVQCPYPVYCKSTESRLSEYFHDFNSHELENPTGFAILAPALSPLLELMDMFDIPTPRQLRVPMFHSSNGLLEPDKTVLALAGLLMSTIFDGVHCIAWIFAFPTYQEQILWRVTAVAMIFTPWLGYLLIMISDYISDGISALAAIIFTTLYITGRTILLILMVTTLRNLPPNAYKEVSWTSFVPHL